MSDKPTVDDPNAALAKLVAENVLATNRSTRATRVIASGIYYSTLAALIAAIPAGIGLLMLLNGSEGAAFFFVLAALVWVGVGIRSIVVMFEEYSASALPERVPHERELLTLVSQAGSTREELAAKREAEAAEREAREREQAARQAQAQAEREQAARAEVARAAAHRQTEDVPAGQDPRKRIAAKYWLGLVAAAVAVAVFIAVVQSLQGATGFSREDFLSDPPEMYNEILKGCPNSPDKSEVRHSFQGTYGIRFQVDSPAGGVSDNAYLTCFAETLTGESIDGLAAGAKRTQGDFEVERTVVAAESGPEQYVTFFPTFVGGAD